MGPIIATKQIRGTLDVDHGGTGTNTQFTSGSVVFAGTDGVYDQDNSNLFWDDTNKALTAGSGVVLKEVADHPVAAAAGTGILWVKNTDPSTLFFTDDAGTDFDLTAGGGISNVVEDTSPQLGANLDANGFDILFDSGNCIRDESGNEQLCFTTTASAVNYVNITNSASGDAPTLATAGDNTNIDFKISPKGSGSVLFNDGSTSSPALARSSQPNTGLYFSGSAPIFSIAGTDRYSFFSGFTLFNTTSTTTGLILQGTGNQTAGNGFGVFVKMARSGTTAVQSGDNICRVAAAAHQGTGYIGFQNAPRTDFVATETWSSGNNGAKYSIYTMPNGASTAIEYLTVEGDGGVEFLNSSAAAVGAAGTAKLRVNSGTLQVSNAGAAYANIATGAGSSPDGADSQIQYNNGGVFGADADFVWDDTNGRLGIGTGSPTNALHVLDSGVPTLLERNGATAAQFLSSLFVKLKTTSDMTDGFGPAITFKIEDSANVDNPMGFIGAVRAGADNTSDVVIGTALAGSSTEKFRVTGAGRVGIGVTAPENQLHVRQSGQSACRFEREEATTNAALGVSFIQAVSTGDMVDNFGPQLSFGIKDTAAVSNAIAYMKAIRAGADNSGKLILGTRDAGAFADRIIIEVGGNVGIGLVASQRLHVLGNVRAQQTGAVDAVFKCDNSTRSWDLGVNAAGTWRLRDITGALDRITVLSSGNVGIGLSPTTKFDVSGTIRAVSSSTALIHIQNTGGTDSTLRTQNASRSYDTGVSSTGSFRVRDLTGAADRLTITNAGYVGIGVVPTGQGLTVDGNIICINSSFGFSLTSNADNNRYGIKYGSAGSVGDTDDLMLTNRETNGGLLFATDNGTSGGAGETLRLNIPGGTTGGALQFQGSASAAVSAASTAALRVTAGGILQISENAGAYKNFFGSTTAAGATGELQFNSAGVLGADSQLFWDDTNNRLAIGASAATRKLHVIDSGMTTRLERTTTSTNAALSGIELMTKTSVNMVNGLGSGIDFMIQDDTVGPNIIAQIYAFRDGADDSGAITFRTFSSGVASENIRLTAAGNVLIGTTTDNAKLAIVGGGIICGAPTGGDKGSGTINVAGDVYKNNTAYANPDYVFEHYFTGSISKFIDSPGAKEYKGLRSLGDVKSFVKENHHLPHIVKEATGIFSRGDKALELIEELFLHAFALEDKIKVLEATAAGGE